MAGRREGCLKRFHSPLLQSLRSLVIQQATLSLRDSESIAEQLSAVHAAAVEELNKTIESYHRTQQEREIVERAVERQQKEHRREQARVAAIDLQDWIMRPKQAPVATDREEVNYA